MTVIQVLLLVSICSCFLTVFSRRLYYVRDQVLHLSTHRSVGSALAALCLLAFAAIAALLEHPPAPLLVAIVLACHAVIGVSNIAGHMTELMRDGSQKDKLSLMLLSPTFGLLLYDRLALGEQSLSASGALLSAVGALLATYIVRRCCAE